MLFLLVITEHSIDDEVQNLILTDALIVLCFKLIRIAALNVITCNAVICTRDDLNNEMTYFDGSPVEFKCKINERTSMTPT